MKIRVLSLFDGISVGMLALKRAGFDVEKYYASEIKTKAMKCSFNNWGDAIEQIGDGSFYLQSIRRPVHR